MKKRIIIVLGILIAAGGIGTGVWYHFKGNGQSGTGDSIVYVSKVSVITGSETTAVNRFAGVVEPQKTVNVKIESGRKVKEVEVKTGEEVKAGQLLFEYDLSSIEDDLKQAQLDLDRLKNEQISLTEQISTLEAEKKKAKAEVTLTFPALIEIVIILLAAFLSFKTTDKQIRIRNHFTWGAIKEVAVLFIGIFITMQPALMLLKAVGPNLGITEPYQMFWATGALSSFLDNTPTYLVFLTTAGTLGFTNGIATTLGTVPVKLLSAISCGAVFMGANTYIGNAPNFMVKTLSDENGINMPSFFGYMAWSLTFLIPVFIIDMLIFFL